MKKKILFLCLSLALVSGLALAECGYSWFAEGVGSGGSGTSHNFHTEEVGMSLTGGFYTVADLATETGRSVILPEDNLIDTAMVLTNHSSIPTQLRVKVEYTYYDSNGAEITAVAEDLSDANLTTAQKEANPLIVDFTDSSDWTYSSGYWYYGGTTGTVPARTAQGGASINAISDIHYSGEYTTAHDATGASLFNGDDITVTVTFEVKQKEYVTWSQLGSVDFSTGV